MHRFYQPVEAFAGNYINSEDRKFISQLSKVLRVKEGDRFMIFDGSGYEYLSQLVSLTPALVKFLIIDKKLGEAELKKEIIIYPSLLKSDKFDWVLQKVTELGVKKIVPVVSDRCIVRDISSAKESRYLEILKEATEQCGGAIIPKFDNIFDFEGAIRSASEDDGLKLIAWEKDKENTFGELAGKIRAASKVHIFIGPEGGYGESEIEYALNSGIRPFSLGSRILRAETASLHLVSLLISQL
ncbi:MAG: RsmE family RNA methyltransferase [Candidatus Buchananbacteria bacterium]